MTALEPPFDIPADLDTPVSAWLKLASFQPRFLLESVEGGEKVGRYSFLGFGEASLLQLDADGLSIDGDLLEVEPKGGPLLDALRSLLERAPRLGPATKIPFHGGLVGVAGFDLVRRFERLPRPHRARHERTEARWIVPRTMLVFDRLTRRAALLSAAGDLNRDKLKREVRAALAGSLPGRRSQFVASPARASFDRGGFCAAVEKGREAIAAGDVYQLVLSIRFEGEYDGDPFQTYRALRLFNPSPYMYFLDFGDEAVIGSSPEALVKLSGREAALRPIAGTRPRGASQEIDQHLEAELLADPKEAAEHVMLVDLARNDLGRVASTGSVAVKPSRVVERYSHVMHLVSGVSGVLAPRHDAFDLFRAVFPAGTVSGAPKLRALELIDELEPVDRGYYSGTVGYFGHGGMDQAIAIRSLFLSRGKYAYQAGAGIVADSVGGREHDEILSKSEALRAALATAQEGL